MFKLINQVSAYLRVLISSFLACSVKTYIYNLVLTMRFRNNLHQELSKSKDWMPNVGF